MPRKKQPETEQEPQEPGHIHRAWKHEVEKVFDASSPGFIHTTRKRLGEEKYDVFLTELTAAMIELRAQARTLYRQEPGSPMIDKITRLAAQLHGEGKINIFSVWQNPQKLLGQVAEELDHERSYNFGHYTSAVAERARDVARQGMENWL